MRQTLSVVIASKNCEDRILGTIEPWKKIANEIIVVDQNSSDQTAELARKSGVKVISNNPHNGNFDLNRKLGIQNAQSQWILYIDTDERPTAGMLQELEDFLKNENNLQFEGVRIPNYFYFLGKQLKHGIYNPSSAEIRMFQKDKWDYPCERGYHHSVSVKGPVYTFVYGYKHFNVNSLSEWFVKTNQYTEHDANQKMNSNNARNLFFAIINAKKFFIRHYFFKLGFLDGFHGFVSVFYFMLYHFTLDLKIIEKKYLQTKSNGTDYLKSFTASTPDR